MVDIKQLDRIDVINTYRKKKTIAETSRVIGVSEQTIRRILIEEEIYWTPRVQEISSRTSSGESVEKVAESLGVSVKAVKTYLPYIRGTYVLGEKSDNAKRIASWRESRSLKVADGVKKSL